MIALLRAQITKEKQTAVMLLTYEFEHFLKNFMCMSALSECMCAVCSEARGVRSFGTGVVASCELLY